jgi:hypothetical protein
MDPQWFLDNPGIWRVPIEHDRLEALVKVCQNVDWQYDEPLEAFRWVVASNPVEALSEALYKAVR